MTLSLEGWPTKAKKAPSLHEVRLTPLDTNPVFQCLGVSIGLLHCRKQFFVSFEISGGSYNPSQNTLRLIKEFEKYILSFMESLIADFFNFLALLLIFYFCKGDWELDYVCTAFRDFSNCCLTAPRPTLGHY